LGWAGLFAAYASRKTYGGNVVPQSTEEAITLLVCVTIMMTGYVLTTIGLALPKK
jgi:hypothetical protein